MPDDAVKRMDIKEFREGGFLQEANRHFFHPLGLALETVSEECGGCGGKGRLTTPVEGRDVECKSCNGSGRLERLGGVWDYRDDPEGIVFDNGYGLDREKAAQVTTVFIRHLKVRNQMFEVKDGVQPLPPAEEEEAG